MLAYLFVVFAVVVRLVLPGFVPWLNFTPVGAALLFFGAHQARKHMWIPVALLAGSDLVLNLFVYHYPVRAEVYVSWAWYAAIVLLGSLLRDNASTVRVLGASLATAGSFFVISNFTAWLVMDGLYARSIQGLMTCYVAAIPFFRNELVSDVLFSLLFFSVPALLVAMKRQPAKVRMRA